MEIKKLKIGSLVSIRNYAEDVEALSGPIAQLGERLNGIQQVAGSIPVGSSLHPLWGLRLGKPLLH